MLTHGLFIPVVRLELLGSPTFVTLYYASSSSFSIVVFPLVVLFLYMLIHPIDFFSLECGMKAVAGCRQVAEKPGAAGQ